MKKMKCMKKRFKFMFLMSKFRNSVKFAKLAPPEGRLFYEEL